MTPEKVCKIIIACAVLHNMAIIWKLPLLEDHLPLSSIPHPDEPFEIEEIGQLAAKHYRDQFSNHNFS